MLCGQAGSCAYDNFITISFLFKKNDALCINHVDPHFITFHFFIVAHLDDIDHALLRENWKNDVEIADCIFTFL